MAFMEFIPNLGRRTLRTVPNLGTASRFLLLSLFAVANRHFSIQQLLKQVYGFGVRSLLLMMVAAFFTGMVLGFQGYYALVRFGATSALGTLVALSLLRELGPVLTALLFAGRAGSALTAEISSMKATEQLSAMEMMAVNPLAWVVAPRLWAGIIVVPILCVIFDLVGIFGGYLISVPVLGVDGGTFWAQMQSNVAFSGDILTGLFKALCFGLVVTWIAAWQGYAAQPTAEGVGNATTISVVTASLAVLGLDFILTAFLFT
ncbi:lipid asymmetry maintenance ABC transporter permease subunit MlaE [Acidithiobacillus ferrooxidans F221]|uniref:lipid asymmetry maintenance ABC transporter permease subunit MlaE n=1 Tax=Acidithiobacillus ferrooxidans TaxID=920 RepID=UPI001C06B76F|nr:lipid asymmetry maintenance ABC transporter permease subunit MlaE [Acidithiobacillus ferrooxidans]MBU2808527.1 lipid asymmetry maintenance ABC transporter permease subunit MlaE [Acidithiobacillus ferrooxidans F221]